MTQRLQSFADYPLNIRQLREQYTTHHLRLCKDKLARLATSVLRNEHDHRLDVELIGTENIRPRVSDLSSLRDSLDTPEPWILIRLNGRARQLSISLGMLQYILSYYDVMPEMIDFLAEFSFQQPTFRSLEFRERRKLDDFQLCYSLVLPLTRQPYCDRGMTFAQIVIHVQGGSNRFPIWICAESSSGMPNYDDFLVNALVSNSLTGVLRTPMDHDKAGNQLIDDVNGSFGSMVDNAWGEYLQRSTAEADSIDHPALSDPRTRPTLLLSRMEKLIHEANISASNLGTNIEALRALHEWSEKYLHRSCLRTTIQNLETHQKLATRLETFFREQRATYMNRASLELTQDMARLGVNILRINYLDRLFLRSAVMILMLFIPGIFVNTFFSTDVVRFASATTEFSSLALIRWLEVTIPLLAIIFLVSYTSQVWSIKRGLSRQKRTAEEEDPEDKTMSGA